MRCWVIQSFSEGGVYVLQISVRVVYRHLYTVYEPLMSQAYSVSSQTLSANMQARPNADDADVLRLLL